MLNGKPVRFVILSQPRTGSTLLCSLFNSHPGVRCLVEPINCRTHNHHMRPVAGATCLLPEAMIHNNIKRALNILWSPEPPPEQWIQSRKRGDVASGFKIMAHQIRGLRNEQEFWNILVREQIPVVLCFRYNIIMQYISDLITIATRQPTCWDGNVRTAVVRVDIKSLELELKRIVDEKTYLIDKVNELKLPKQRLKYEDFKDNIRPVEDVLDWLIGERYHLTTKLSKQNPDSLKARVTNYDELAVEINRLGLGHLLADSEPGE